MSSEATDPADRLAEIKASFEHMVTNDEGYDDIDWLLGEVERLRAALASLRELAQHSIDDREMQPLVYSDTIIEIVDAALTDGTEAPA